MTLLLIWSTFLDALPDIGIEIRRFADDSFNASDLPEDTVSILIPPGAFDNQTSTDTSIVFSTFNTSDAYPLSDQVIPQFGVASSVVSATVVGSEGSIVSNITVVLRLNVKVDKKLVFVCKLLQWFTKCNVFFYFAQDSQLPVCVFWDASAAGTSPHVLPI